jgi:flagellar hook-associated protein 2
VAGTSVDGLVSGMSTSAIIDQLIQLEGRGQAALQARVKSTESVISALQSVNAKLAALGTAADALTIAGAFGPVKATSSSDAVLATANAGALTGALTFDVTALAAAAAHVSSTTYASLDDVAAGTITITKGTGPGVDVAVGDGKLSSVVAAINAKSDAGVRAAAVQVAPGQYKLQLTSTTSGSASSFTVTGVTGGTVQSVAGADAKIRVGTQDIISSTNAFTDILPGVTFTAKRLENGVTIEVKSDVESVAGKVDAMVKAFNAAVDEIAKHASYDTAAKRSGVLLSDSRVRTLQSQLLGTVAQAVPGGMLKDVGIELTRDGKITFDSTKLKAAFEADPAAAEKMFSQTVTWTQTGGTGMVRVVSTSHRTGQGDHAVTVTSPATQAVGEYDVTSVDVGTKFRVDVGGSFAEYTVQAGDDFAAVTTGLQASASAQGARITISSNATGATTGQITLTAQDYGSATSLRLTDATGATETIVDPGNDVAGTIGALAATGSGQILSTVGKTGADADIIVEVTGATATGTVKVEAGFAQRLETRAKAASDSVDGTLTTAIADRQTTVKGYNDQIAAWDVRLNARRTALQRQFANLEVALGRMREQSNWLAGQLASLPQSAA